MRIDDKRSPRNLSSSAYATSKTGINNNADKGFTDVLDKQHRRHSKDDLDKLLSKLEDIGKRLVESFSIYELKNYKDTMKDFLQKTQGQVYRLKEEIAHTKKGRTRVMHLIEKIDTELEELSNVVLSRQKDQVKLLEKMDHIRGLLVDLYS
ncbi:MAG: DUF327 domain-containing protein [Firmicutes bacterium HGW-Firmicutes-12]|jgi:hypothetical protein|nr:MAG: DUF327 domain-containing protein [Firmicutes bacterium HGW-Firmicutes-12]